MNRNSTRQLVLKHGRLIFGRDFPAEEKSAGLDWLERRAAQGCSLAQRLLGTCPVTGDFSGGQSQRELAGRRRTSPKTENDFQLQT